MANDTNTPLKRYCRTLTLRPDSRLIAEYRRRHSAGAIWPEIVEGIRSVGITAMDIYILGTTLFMIVEMPADLDWDETMQRLSTFPRQQEWEDYMSIFQQAEAGSTGADKWQMMEQMFHLYTPGEMAEASEGAAQ